MKIQYSNEFIKDLGIGDPATCVYQFIYNINDKNDTKTLQHFIMHGLGLCVKVEKYVAHMFYAWSFSHDK